VQWHATYEAPGLGGAHNVVPTRDGGWLMSADGTTFLIVKVDREGNVLWARDYGDGGYAFLRVLEAEDGSILVTGLTWLGDGFAPNGRAVLLDADGNVLWQKVYGRPFFVDFLSGAVEGFHGNFVVLGSSVGNYWVLELDRATGDVVWQHVYGGHFEDTGLVIAKVSGNRYLVVGASDTFSAGGLRNWWALVLSQTGRVEHQLSLGGADAEDPHAATATSDGGFMIGGGSASFSGGFGDLWLVKFDANAQIEWQKTYGFADRTDSAWQIHETQAGYTVIGDSYTYPFLYEVILLALDEEGNVAPGSCGSVLETDAVPWSTDVTAGRSKAETWDLGADRTDVKVTVSRTRFPIEACISQ
jgi:hypothetical protein